MCWGRELVLACDGIWDVMSNTKCIERVTMSAGKEETHWQGARDRAGRMLGLDSMDNMSIVALICEAVKSEAAAKPPLKTRILHGWGSPLRRAGNRRAWVPRCSARRGCRRAQMFSWPLESRPRARVLCRMPASPA